MTLHPQWKYIVRHAYSVRLIVIAMVLSAIEALEQRVSGAAQTPKQEAMK